MTALDWFFVLLVLLDITFIVGALAIASAISAGLNITIQHPDKGYDGRCRKCDAVIDFHSYHIGAGRIKADYLHRDCPGKKKA